MKHVLLLFLVFFVGYVIYQLLPNKGIVHLILKKHGLRLLAVLLVLLAVLVVSHYVPSMKLL